MKSIGRILFVALAALLGQTAAGQSGGEWRIETVAGTGEWGFSGDGGLAVEAQLRNPTGVAVDEAGNLYITGNERIRMVDAAGLISTVAGNGVRGFSGDGGPAVQAQLNYPRGVAVDGSGNIYIVDAGNHRIRKVDAAGAVSTVAGSGRYGYGGDGGAATSASLSNPRDAAADSSGNVYIADTFNHRIRKVDAAGVITTVAGMGDSGRHAGRPQRRGGYSGDGGPAVRAQLRFPRGTALDGSGNLYIADTGNNRVRRVDTAGVITTFAGTGTEGFSGDGGPATQAQLDSPLGVAVDGSGNIYIADAGNYRIRRVDAATGIITTIAGTEWGASLGDGGPATQASIRPGDVDLDAAGNIYIADGGQQRVRRLTPLPKDTPRIFSGGIGLVTGAPFVNRISPNAYFWVFGRGFTPEGAGTASPALDAAGRVATELAGVCLEIDGKRAPLFAVFPGQINAQAPHDLTPEQAQVVGAISEVTAIRNCGAENERRSFAETVEAASFSPAFFNLGGNSDGRNPIVAARSDGTLAGPPGAVPGVEVAPAEPGEIVTFWGTGFGLTDPLLEAGQIPAAAARLAGEIEFTLGGITLFPEDMLYAGAAPGLAGIYQFTVRVPRGFPDSLRAPVIAAVNGVSTPEGPFLTVRRRE